MRVCDVLDDRQLVLHAVVTSERPDVVGCSSRPARADEKNLVATLCLTQHPKQNVMALGFPPMGVHHDVELLLVREKGLGDSRVDPITRPERNRDEVRVEALQESEVVLLCSQNEN